MTWSTVILLVSVGIAAVLLAALVCVVFRKHGLTRSGERLIGALALVFLVLVVGDVLEHVDWAAKEADLVGDIVLPLLPVLWLFFFVTELEVRQRRQAERNNEQLLAIHDVAARLMAQHTPSAVIDAVVESTCRIFDVDICLVSLPNPDTEELAVRAQRGFEWERLKDLRFGPGQGVTGRAYALGRVVHTQNLERDAHPASLRALRERGIGSIAAVPLTYASETVGVLALPRREAEPLAEADLRLLRTLSSHAAAAIRNARLYEQLRDSEARFRMLVENAQVAIAVVDPERRVIMWNQGAEGLFGWSADEMVGESIERIYPPDKRDTVRAEILPALDRQGVWMGEFPVRKADGSMFTALLNLSRVQDHEGRVICTLGIILDVTYRTELREQLIQAQKMETVAAMAGGIAHDFNNLLTGILGFAGLLSEDIPEDSELQTSVHQLEDAANRGTELVRQLLSFSRRQPTEKRQVRVNEVVEEAATLAQRTLHHNIELETDLASDLRPIHADPTQIHQVLMNLAINARDAMPEGGVLTIRTGNVELHPETARPAGLAPGNYVQLTVADTGMGMPEEVRSRIFEPFFTTKGEEAGTGLGLATAFAIVNRHHGRIACHSTVGEGTTFQILLPAAGTSVEAEAETVPAD